MAASHPSNVSLGKMEVTQQTSVRPFSDLFSGAHLLGKGAQGTVFKAKTKTDEFTSSGTVVAVKLVPASNAHLVRETMKEVELLRLVNTIQQGANLRTECNPFIVCYFGSTIVSMYMRTGNIQIANGTYLAVVMEFIDGNTIEDYIQEVKRRLNRQNRPYEISPDATFTLMNHLIRGLSFIHARGVAHRDIKPANLMYTSGGQFKYIDFGLACSQPQASISSPALCTLNQTGTPIYMAPEMPRLRSISFVNNPLIDVLQKADVWSLGITFYHFIFGEEPWGDVQDMEELQQAWVDRQPLISRNQMNSYRGDPNILIIINSMCAYDYHRRPSAAELVELIESL